MTTAIENDRRTWIDAHRASCDGTCELCEAYDTGYSRGKDALEFELLHWDGSHVADDGCRPCVIARHVQEVDSNRKDVRNDARGEASAGR